MNDPSILGWCRRRAVSLFIMPCLLTLICGNAGCGTGDTLVESLTGVFGSGDVDPADLTACGPVAIAQFIPDCPLSLVCFTSACDAHNRCYGDCEATQAKCDLRFYFDMLEICRRRFFFSTANRRVCETLASAYGVAVSAFGAEAFEQTQLAACSVDQVSPFAPGICCLPEEPCRDSIFKFECDELGGSFGPFATCDELSCDGPANDNCANRAVRCSEEDTVPIPNRGRCAGNPDEVCFPTQPLCSDDSVCLREPIEGYFCEFDTDNRLSTTDGPDAVAGCSESGPKSFQADVWYEYRAPCDGSLTLRMCGLESYDGMLAVFGNQEPGSECTCPSDNTDLLSCDDDFCGGASTSAVFLDDVLEGACYTIRVGGWSPDGTAAAAAVAAGKLQIEVQCRSDGTVDDSTSSE